MVMRGERILHLYHPELHNRAVERGGAPVPVSGGGIGPLATPLGAPVRPCHPVLHELTAKRGWARAAVSLEPPLGAVSPREAEAGAEHVVKVEAVLPPLPRYRRRSCHLILHKRTAKRARTRAPV